MINNWEKYNKRADIKSPHWFAMSNRFFDDPEFYDFKSEEKLAWIFILSQCSLSNSNEIRVNIFVFFQKSGIKKQYLKSSIQKLKERLIITVTYGEIRSPSVREHHAIRSLHDMTGHDMTEQNIIHNDFKTKNKAPQPKASDSKFPFEEVYKTYPRKEGKERGLRIFLKEIKTEPDFQNWKRAVEHYTFQEKKKGSEKQYIKHFDTFMGCWRDYIETPEEIKPLCERYPEFFEGSVETK